MTAWLLKLDYEQMMKKMSYKINNNDDNDYGDDDYDDNLMIIYLFLCCLLFSWKCKFMTN